MGSLCRKTVSGSRMRILILSPLYDCSHDTNTSSRENTEEKYYSIPIDSNFHVITILWTSLLSNSILNGSSGVADPIILGPDFLQTDIVHGA